LRTNVEFGFEYMKSFFLYTTSEPVIFLLLCEIFYFWFFKKFGSRVHEVVFLYTTSEPAIFLLLCEIVFWKKIGLRIQKFRFAGTWIYFFVHHIRTWNIWLLCEFFWKTFGLRVHEVNFLVHHIRACNIVIAGSCNFFLEKTIRFVSTWSQFSCTIHQAL